MRKFLTLASIVYLIGISTEGMACHTEVPIVMLGQVKESVNVEAEGVGFSTFPGTKWETKLDVKFVPKANANPEVPAAPSGLVILYIQRGDSFGGKNSSGERNPDSGEGEIKATLPNGKVVTINLKLKPRTKGCGSHEIEYN